ncbi:MAG: hypothetical protein HKN44_13485 [Ilumatobacter sp.]|nr:hypothetical protein [Ilumatobacter sp.]
MAYEHTQTSYVALVVLDVVVTVTILAFVLGGSPAQPIVVAVVAFSVIAAIVYGFSRLTVRVDPAAVTASFAWGWPRKVIPTDEIVSVRAVRNRWYHGWGVRKVARGWMYNVWGLDAVELERRSGKVFRIGTDQPVELAAVIAAATES